VDEYFIIFAKDEFQSGNTLKDADIDNEIIGKINSGELKMMMNILIQSKKGVIIEDKSFDIFRDWRDRLQIIISKIEFSEIWELS